MIGFIAGFMAGGLFGFMMMAIIVGGSERE